MWTAVAIGLGLVAAVCFALAAAQQHRAVGRHVERTAQTRHLDVRHFWALVRTPRWLAGMGLGGLGALLHINALRLAPVAVVQPVGVMAVPLSVLMTARRTGNRPPALVWLGVLATVVGVFGFVLLTAGGATSEVPALDGILVVSAVVAATCVALVLAARKAPGRWPTLLWASAGACAFGLASAYVKAMFLILGSGAPLTSPLVWGTALVMVLAYVLGAWMVQHGYLAGSPETVVGALTVTDPVVAVLIGLVLLGEGGFAPITSVGMVVCAALAVLGVVALSSHHPEVEKIRRPVDQPVHRPTRSAS